MVLFQAHFHLKSDPGSNLFDFEDTDDRDCENDELRKISSAFLGETGNRAAVRKCNSTLQSFKEKQHTANI